MLGRELSCAAVPYAHTPREDGAEWHPWTDHSTSVSTLSCGFGTPFSAGPLCRLIGLTHDAGKLTEAVQHALRLRAIDHGPRLGVPHKWEGAALATLLIEAGNRPMAQAMALANFGHHHAIPNRLDGHLPEIMRFVGENANALDALIELIESHTRVDLRKLAADVELPTWIDKPPDIELFTRMCHSALVDADFLDTAAHFQARPEPWRGHEYGADALLTTFESAYRNRYTKADADMSELDRLRWTYFEQARRIGAEPAPSPGAIYRLPAPTGCGKTMTAAAFALSHAAHFGKRRVVIAVPFTSITTQNAEAYREMFSELGDEVVLEHHSNILREEIADSGWRRLAASNWDAEFVVTTTVQLLESLFSNRPSATRKLHRLVNSVVVIDEVQSLPIHLLPAILRMLKELSTHYGVTFLLASATQPAFWSFDEWSKLQLVDLMPVHDVPPITERVKYDIRDAEQPWEEIAAEVGAEEQVLAIVNTTADAQRLHGLIVDATDQGQRVLHLSTRMYNDHRARVLAEAKQLLEAHESVILVSTQLIEAGVDIDFPVVYRALAPADSIVQSAGRCNREGKLGVGAGRVVVFQPADGGTPPGAYKSATATTRNLFIEQADRAMEQGRTPSCFGDPAAMERYYRLRYAEEHGNSARTKAVEINQYRDRLAFEKTHEAFQMIDDTSVAVIVDDGSEDSDHLRFLIERLRESDYVLFSAERRLLNCYTASAPKRQMDKRADLFEQLAAGPLLWTGEYDEQVGLVLDAESGVTIW